MGILAFDNGTPNQYSLSALERRSAIHAGRGPAVIAIAGHDGRLLLPRRRAADTLGFPRSKLAERDGLSSKWLPGPHYDPVDYLLPALITSSALPLEVAASP